MSLYVSGLDIQCCFGITGRSMNRLQYLRHYRKDSRKKIWKLRLDLSKMQHLIKRTRNKADCTYLALLVNQHVAMRNYLKGLLRLCRACEKAMRVRA